MSTMSDLKLAFATLEDDPHNTQARRAIENIIASLRHTIFQSTAAALRDLLTQQIGAKQ